MFRLVRRWQWLSALALGGLAAVGFGIFTFSSVGSEGAKAGTNSRLHGDEPAADAGMARPRVEVVQPQVGGIERKSVQPGTVIAFESAQLYAKVSGYLKFQPVDIGSQVKRGDLLAEIDAPELFKDVDRAKAAVDEAVSEVAQVEARVLTAKASREAALASVKQAEAEVGRAVAARSFRDKQHQRIKELYQLKSIDARLVDEKFEELNAAAAAEDAARAAVVTGQANVSAATAKVEEAKSDVKHANAQVEVRQAALARAQVLAEYTRITSPYDGVVTKRNFFRGDFIRAAEQGGMLPLLCVDQIGVMRVVVQVPDRDVPFTNEGDEAEVEIDALPGKTFPSKVARVAAAEDPDTRTMRTEIDLANDQRLLRQGMYGRVTIYLGQTAKAQSIPSSCLVGDIRGDKGNVFVVKGGVARLHSVRFGGDNGLRIEVVEGLAPEDDVVQRPSEALTDGAAVDVIRTRAAEKSH